MTYLETVEFIRDLANEVNVNGDFIHGRRVDGSAAYGGNFPMILLEPFITSKDLGKGSATCNLSIAFMFSDKAENTAEQREVIIGQADVMCSAFEKALYARKVDVGTVREQPFYLLFASSVSGYLLTFTITSKIASC